MKSTPQLKLCILLFILIGVDAFKYWMTGILKKNGNMTPYFHDSDV